MALKAGYYGIKKKILNQLLAIPAEIDDLSEIVDDLSEAVETKADADLIAPTQLTLTADKPYVVGEQFIYEGKLYKVTQDIAKDATITVGTNAELAGSITAQLSGEIVYKDYYFAHETLQPGQTGLATFAAGTIGTRGASCQHDISDMIDNGYTPTSVVVTDTFGSSLYIPYVFIYTPGKQLILALYRATDQAVGNAYTNVKVGYIKTA